jgi:gluconokinase
MKCEMETKLPPDVTAVLLMGVCGSGKTVIGARLADALAWRYYEGDKFHPPQNVAKMRQGIALSDEDRWPWLARIAQQLDLSLQQGEHAVFSCSALKESYRMRLGVYREGIALVHLHADPELLRERMLKRAAETGHFMPPALLPSQLRTLEAPAAALNVDTARPISEIVELIITSLKLKPLSPHS